jgi:hypothetical protein
MNSRLTIASACPDRPHISLQIRDLKSTVQSLQLSAAQSVDAEVATLRGKVAQLEAGLKSKDKELEKMRWVIKRV